MNEFCVGTIFVLNLVFSDWCVLGIYFFGISFYLQNFILQGCAIRFIIVEIIREKKAKI